MGVKENTLPSKSSITASDRLRTIGSDDKSYRALVSDVAKYIVENYNGSTLAGSAQSVQAALAALNSKIGTMNLVFTVADGIPSGGTIGQRAAQVILDNPLASNQTVIGIVIVGIALSIGYSPLVFMSSNKFYCNYYRASTSAFTEAQTQVQVRVIYMNN